MEDKLTANIKVEVKSYHESNLDKSIIYYVIEIMKRGAEKWTVEKRFSEFDDLHKNLKKVFSNIPDMPSKTVFKVKSSDVLEKRREDLDKLLKALVVRPEIFNSEPLKKFLQIENFAPETIVVPPKLLCEMSGFAQGLRSFHYQPDKGVLFVLISDMNVASRVDSYLTNMKMPWEKDIPPTIVSVGAVECYAQVNMSEYKFEKLWNKTFNAQAICLNWDQASNLLSVGLDDGKISCIKVSSELNYMKAEEILNNKIHQARVMGVAIDNVSGYMYSVSEDKHLKITATAKNEILHDLTLGATGLTSIMIEREFKRGFVSDRSGNVYILDISVTPAAIIHSVTVSLKGAIRGLFFSPGKNYVFTCGYDDGEIAIIDIEKPGREKYAKQTASLKGKKKARVISWSSNRGEIYVGAEDGTVTIWNAKKAISIYVIKAHENAITYLQWIEDKNMLMTSGKEKTLKFWMLPNEWRDKKIEFEEEREAEIRKATETMLIMQKKQERARKDSDDDDLAGWHKF